MGLLDKLKGAVHAVTGGAATVEIQYAEKVNSGGDWSAGTNGWNGGFFGSAAVAMTASGLGGRAGRMRG